MEYSKDTRDVKATVTALFEISNAVNNADNLDDLYASIHESLNKILNLENFAIAIYHEEKDSMTFPYFVDELDANIGEVFDISQKQSLSARVIKAGKPLMFYGEDILKMPNRPDRIAFHPACKVWAGAPLKIKGRSFGALIVQSYRSKDAFKKSDLDLLNAVAEFVAISIDRKQIQIARKQSDEVSRVLRGIARAVHSAENLFQLFESIHHTLRRILDVSNFFIAIVDTKERTLYFPYYVDEIDNDFSPITNFNADDSLSGLIVSQRKPILLKSEDLETRANQNGVWGPMPLTWMGAPLIIKDEVIGVVAVQSYSDANLYDQRDLQILSTVSVQMAIAIDRKRAEDALRESEKRFRQIYNNILDVYFEVNFGGVILEVSPTIEKYTKCKSDELIGTSIYNISTNSEDRDKLVELVSNQEAVNNYEVTLTFKGDNQYVLSINTEVLMDDQGYPVKLIGIMRDVTDKKRNEYERERSLSLLEATFESTADGLLVTDKNGIWSNINQKFIDIWGIQAHLIETESNKEAIDYVISTIVDPEKFMANFIKLGDDFRGHTFDVVELKNGKIIECYSYPQNIDEEIVGRVWSFRDITEHKQMESALRVSEEKLHDITKQTEQFSLAAASMISVRDEQQFFNKISDAIVNFSDFKRVLISLFKSEFPFRDIIAYGGIEGDVVDKLRKVEMHKNWYDTVFMEENNIGQYSYFIPHTQKNMLNQEATVYGSGPVSEDENKWHPEDNLFVRMKDEEGKTIGVISVDESKSGLKPNPETVRPLEIFASLISQIVILKKEQKERRKAELWASEQRLALMVEQSPLAVIEWNLDFEVIKWNLVAEKMFGYTAQEAVGRPAAELVVTEEARPVVDQVWRDLIDQRGGTHSINENITKDGRTIICEWHNTSLINTEGKTLGVLSVIQDVTERKLAEEALIHAKTAAEEATRAKSSFLANMSHEIRTPMNAIIGLSHLAMKTQLTQQQLDYQKKIHSAANSLLRLIDDILDFSKIEAGRLDLEKKHFDLREVLERVASIISVESAEKDVEFSLNVPDSIPSYLRGDALRLEQVLINLASNAVKFTSKGVVRVDVELVEEDDREARLRFVISDTGIGMSPEQVERLFQPFHQADCSITRKYGGTGLGLAICKRLSEMMGGGIQVRSDLGIGSKFSFTAKFEKSKEEMPQIITDISIERMKELLAGYRLLLVEDNETNLQVARELLERIGINTAAAANGLEAVELAAKERFDGILMDLQMPKMDGLTATREIRKGLSRPDLPILAMTANALASDREDCLSAGMNDYIVKPIKPATLYGTLLRWLRPDVDANGAHKQMMVYKPAISEKLTDLPHLEGVDTQVGLGSVNGDWKLYTKLLNNFYSRHQGIKEEIQRELELGRQDVAQRLVHTIKGVSGTIGAKKLSEISAQLEFAIKKGSSDQIPKLMESFTHELGRIMTALDAFMHDMDSGHTEDSTGEGEPETQSTKGLDVHRIKKLIQELSVLIDERDSDVIKVIDKIKSMLGSTLVSDNLSKLESQLNSFKFEHAKETLEAVTRELDL